MSDDIKAIVEGGSASAGPPLGPALGPMGVNTQAVVDEINEKTKNFKGMKIPVTVSVDSKTKEFTVKVGSPPTSSLILKALGIQKGGGDAEIVGDLTFQQLLEVAKDKQDGVLAKNLKNVVKEIVGVCQSMAVTIEGRMPKHMIEEINLGRFDKLISGESTEVPPPLERKKEQEIEIIGVKEEEPEPDEEPEKAEGEAATEEAEEKTEEKPEK